MNVNDVVNLLRKKLEGTTQAAWAEKHGMSQPYIGDVLLGRRPPAKKLLEALGLEKVITYRKK